ncbi:hypothetical protein EBR96_03975 [bacterium]|nr:hypothetical protein [bacterium]
MSPRFKNSRIWRTLILVLGILVTAFLSFSLIHHHELERTKTDCSLCYAFGTLPSTSPAKVYIPVPIYVAIIILYGLGVQTIALTTRTRPSFRGPPVTVA